MCARLQINKIHLETVREYIYVTPHLWLLIVYDVHFSFQL